MIFGLTENISDVLLPNQRKARNKHDWQHDGDPLFKKRSIGDAHALLQCEPSHHQPSERANTRRIRAKVGAKDDRGERGSSGVRVHWSHRPRGSEGGGLPLGDRLDHLEDDERRRERLEGGGGGGGGGGVRGGV